MLFITGALEINTKSINFTLREWAMRKRWGLEGRHYKVTIEFFTMAIAAQGAELFLHVS